MDSKAVSGYIVAKAQLEDWWKSFLGQDPNKINEFDFDKVAENLPTNDDQAGDIFFKRLEVFLSHVSKADKWFAWDGRIHVPCTGDLVAELLVSVFHKQISQTIKKADGVLEELLRGVSDESDETKKKIRLKRDVLKKAEAYNDRIGNSSGSTGLVKTLKSKFSVADDYFDKDYDYLAVKNCVFDLRKIRAGDLANCKLDHNPSLPITRYLDVNYNKDLHFEGSAWERYLESSVKDGDQDIIDHLQRVTGAAFMGEHSLRTIINFVGPPGSGKSLYLDTFNQMGKKGSGYCSSPPSSAIVETQGDNFAQNFFKGKRMINISEPPTNAKIDDDFVKQFTGDASVSTRTLNQEATEWQPQGILYIASNANLRINSRDPAIVERVQVIRFPYEFRDKPVGNQKKKDNTLLNKFTNDPDEKSRIFNWVFWGMYYYSTGTGRDGSVERDPRSLEPPQAIKAERSKVVASGSPALRWIHDMLEEEKLVDINVTPQELVNDGAHLDQDEAYRMFKLWAADNGEYRVPAKRFFIADIANMYPEFKYGTIKKFRGLMKPKMSKPQADTQKDTIEMGLGALSLYRS